MLPDLDRGIVLKPIGTVRSPLKERLDARDEGLRQEPARIELFPKFREGLDGLEIGDEALVLFWLDRIGEEERKVLKDHPQGDPNRELKGVFATRSPARPNPIGATTVRITGREDCVIVVTGLDALDGTPVVDIKIKA